MLEAYTALGALASASEKIQLSTLVTGNTYRNPTLLAKAVTTLDVVSRWQLFQTGLAPMSAENPRRF